MDEQEQLQKALYKKGVQEDLSFSFNYKGQVVKKTVGEIMGNFFLYPHSAKNLNSMIDDLEGLNHDATVEWVWGIGFGQFLQQNVEQTDARMIQGLIALAMSGIEVTFSVKQKGIKEKWSVKMVDNYFFLEQFPRIRKKITIRQLMEQLLNWSGRIDDIPKEAYVPLLNNSQKNIIQ